MIFVIHTTDDDTQGAAFRTAADTSGKITATDSDGTPITLSVDMVEARSDNVVFRKLL